MSDARGGASSDAIQEHYDVGNEFYRLWLDETFTYSCALWEGDDDTLADAQRRKLDHHIRESGAGTARRVLDIGCGWGSLLRRLGEQGEREALVGLTLSEAQQAHIRAQGLPWTELRLESWAEHRPEEPYDAIVSIGALEHFVTPETPADERVEIYRHFFSRCRELLRPGGQLSLQTMAYGPVGSFVRGALSSIFPESDLPRLSQLALGFEQSFELRRLRNDPDHYARTGRCWLQALQKHREEASLQVGEQRTRLYEKFLEAGIRGYDARIFHLYRLTLRRLDHAV